MTAIIDSAAAADATDEKRLAAWNLSIRVEPVKSLAYSILTPAFGQMTCYAAHKLSY